MLTDVQTHTVISPTFRCSLTLDTKEKYDKAMWFLSSCMHHVSVSANPINHPYKAGDDYDFADYDLTNNQKKTFKILLQIHGPNI